MSRVKIPINQKPYQNIVQSALSKFTDSLIDMYVQTIDDKIVKVKRPGLLESQNLSTFSPVDGLKWWKKKGVAIANSFGNTYKMDNSSLNLVDITGDKLEEKGIVTYADNGQYIVMANGGRMIYTDGTANTTYITDADAPTNVSHVAFIDQYLIANSVGTGRFHFAIFTGLPTIWYAIDFYTAESNPDDVLGLSVLNEELVLIGSKTTEFWASDGSPFSRVGGKVFNVGCIAKSSIVDTGTTLYWLSDQRRFVGTNGGYPQIVSTPYDKTIQSFTTVEDAICYYTYINGKDFIKMIFPSENISFEYNIQEKSWSQIAFWNTVTATHDAFLGRAYCFAEDWNIHLIGDRRSSIIHKMSEDYYDDNGTPINWLIRTGNIDHGNRSFKISNRLYLALDRGTGIEGDIITDPELLLKFRDNGVSEYGNDIPLSLGKIGDTGTLMEIGPLGRYQTRQYQISSTANVPATIIEAEEDVIELE